MCSGRFIMYYAVYVNIPVAKTFAFPFRSSLLAKSFFLLMVNYEPTSTSDPDGLYAPPPSKRPTNWIKIGIPVLVLVIIGAVVGGVVGSRHHNNNKASSSGSGDGSSSSSSLSPQQSKSVAAAASSAARCVTGMAWKTVHSLLS